MALTVTFNEYNGASETKTTGITAINFASKDASGLTVADYPIRAGDNSFSKYIKANFANFAGEGVSTVSIPKIHIANYTAKTGIALTYGFSSISYTKPSTALLADNAVPTILPGAQNLALNDSNSGTLVADGESNYFRMQIQAGATAVTGAIDSGTLTLTYTVA